MRMRVAAAFTILLGAAHATPALAQSTNFSQEVYRATDTAMAYLDSQGAFNNPSSAGADAGLVALALLEMRVDASQRAAIQGYAGAPVAHQARLDRVMAYMIGNPGTRFEAIRDGQALMALSVYLRTGGPNAAARDAINLLFDRIASNQGPGGYWCRSGDSCSYYETETTLPVIVGLSYARAVFSDPAVPDAPRLLHLDEMTAKTRAAFAANGTTSGFSDEAGHGLVLDLPVSNTSQDTAAGLWIELIGGADLNDPAVQQSLRWLYHRYAYKTIAPTSAGFGGYFSRYVWSMAKAFSLIEDSGVHPSAGNLGPADLGTLSPLADPAFTFRELRLDPATVSRVALLGNEGPGYYSDPLEPARWYFDFAYTVISRIRLNGFIDPPFGSSVGLQSRFADQAYYILVLQSLVGGGCANGGPACNQPPSAADDSGSTFSGTAVTVTVLTNDTDADEADSLSVTAVTQPANGEASIDAGTKVAYTPFPGFAGVDTFTYTVSDTGGATATATVTINVTKRTATVTAGGGTKAYGASDPALLTSWQGFAAEDQPSITFATTRAAGDDAGPYTTTAVATGAPLENYDVTYATGTFTITAAPTATALVSNPNPSTSGQAVTFTATVSGASGPPPGTVAFFAGATLLGTANLDTSGAATFTTSTLATGLNAITAVYDATLNYLASDATLTQNVILGSTTTVLVSSVNPAPVGTAVTFTATVTAIGTPAGIPEETVTFLDGVTVLGTGVLGAQGKATFTTTSLAVGSHPITATYGGSASASGSRSAILNQVATCPLPGGAVIAGCPAISLGAVAQQIQVEPSIKPAAKKLLLATLKAADHAANRRLPSARVLLRVFIGEVRSLKRSHRIDAAAADRIIADALQVLGGL